MNQAIAELVRRRDPDRFLTALFAPPDKRDTLLTLYAFNHELARAREVVSQPPLALIRLQWWREVVDGAQRRHEVAEPLRAAVDHGELHADDLRAVIEARELEAEPAIETLSTWRDYLLRGSGGLAVAAARLLDAPDPEAARPFGAAYGAAGVLRSVVPLARQQRCLLPADVLAAHGLSPEAVIAAPAATAVISAVRQLAADANIWLAHRAHLPKRAIAAVLPGSLARRDLRRLPQAPVQRGIGDRLAVMIAGVTGRV
jgi:phytoene synthase